MSVKGSLITVKGDVTNPQSIYDNEIAIIPHCCNNLKVMGAGVALVLKNKWPGVEHKYFESETTLGTVSFCLAEDDKIVIANMIGQNGTVSLSNPKPVKYWALARAMIAVLQFCTDECKDDKPVIHTPKFGSDLAQGDWNFILELIREIWLENGIDVVVYEFEPDKSKWGVIG